LGEGKEANLRWKFIKVWIVGDIQHPKTLQPANIWGQVLEIVAREVELLQFFQLCNGGGEIADVILADSKARQVCQSKQLLRDFSADLGV